MSEQGLSGSSSGGSKGLAWILGLVISVLFFWLAARNVEWDQMLRTFASIVGPMAWTLVAVACLCTLLRMPARAARWFLLVRSLRGDAPKPRGSISRYRLFLVTTMGAALDNILPARAGDFARAGILRRDGLKATGAFATIVVERVVDVAATQILLAAALLSAPLLEVPLPPWLWRAGALTFTIAMTALAVMILGIRHRLLFERLLTRLITLLPGGLREKLGRRLEETAAAFLDGFEAASPAGRLGGLLGWSLVIHGTNILPVWCILLACDLFAGSAGLAPALIITTFMAFAVMLPAAPGQMGTIHYAAVAALALFGVQESPALAFALLFHATQYAPVTLLGLFFLAREGVSWHPRATMREKEI